jgi:hypothetical protein
MNPNKLFNYLLQAIETEHNIFIINEAHTVLNEYNSKLILYTYDSMLFDFKMDDGIELLLKLRDTISQNNKFPVKIKAGGNYHNMKDMTSRVA